MAVACGPRSSPVPRSPRSRSSARAKHPPPSGGGEAGRSAQNGEGSTLAHASFARQTCGLAEVARRPTLRTTAAQAPAVPSSAARASPPGGDESDRFARWPVLGCSAARRPPRQRGRPPLTHCAGCAIGPRASIRSHAQILFAPRAFELVEGQVASPSGRGSEALVQGGPKPPTSFACRLARRLGL